MAFWKGFFDRMPYTNLHELNLDWIIRKIQTIPDIVREYLNTATDLPFLSTKTGGTVNGDVISTANISSIGGSVNVANTEAIGSAQLGRDNDVGGFLNLWNKDSLQSVRVSASPEGGGGIVLWKDGTRTVGLDGDNGEIELYDPVTGNINLSLSAYSDSLTVYEPASGTVIWKGGKDVLCLQRDVNNPDCYYVLGTDSSKVWFNPPMIENVEYKTVFRHNGKPLYTKLITLGTLPNSSFKQVDNLADYVDTIISASLYAENISGDGCYFWSSGTLTYYIGNYGSPYIGITTNEDMSGRNGYLVMQYTKTR